jgi:glutaredoxin/glutathione-dependent peroxiredoxin
MPGLDPGIHALPRIRRDVDGRDEPGHDGEAVRAEAMFPWSEKYTRTCRPVEGEPTMTIQVGDKLPEAKFRVMTAEGPQVKTTDDVFKGKKVALFAVPGAYTGTCHKMHLPSIFLNAYAIKNKGVDAIAIVSVNDVFVMNAWKRDTDQRDEATFLADGNADFTKAIGMELDASANGLGIRSKRYSMLVEDGVVKKLNLEAAPGKVEVSGGETLLAQL